MKTSEKKLTPLFCLCADYSGYMKRSTAKIRKHSNELYERNKHTDTHAQIYLHIYIKL